VQGTRVGGEGVSRGAVEGCRGHGEAESDGAGGIEEACREEPEAGSSGDWSKEVR